MPLNAERGVLLARRKRIELAQRSLTRLYERERRTLTCAATQIYLEARYKQRTV